MSYLKKATVDVVAVGKVDITELNAIARAEVFDQKADTQRQAVERMALVCKYGAWPEKSAEEIGSSLSLESLTDLATKILDISVPSKN